jgi:ATP-dependent RNA helicase DeaD
LATETEAAAPAKKRARKSSEPAAEITEATGTTATTEATAEVEAKPKRTRAKKTAEVVEAPASDDDAIVDEVPAKPKRSRAKNAAEIALTSDPDAESIEAVAAEAPVKKSRKKAEPKSLVEIAGDESFASDEDDELDASEDASASAYTDEPVEKRVTFKDLGLTDSLLRSITAVGYEEPTPIQLATIPVLIEGADLIAQAQTGSGKTAAFGLPIIERIDPRHRRVQAIILTPTRELAIQVSEALHKYGRHKEVETLPIYGGQPYERQFRGLQRGPQIVVGTPGRVMDHMRRGTLDLSDIAFFVLDEADEMLDMGFIEDIEWILEQVPESRQTALFSATMPPRISDLASRYMNEPERISVVSKQMTVPEVTQAYYEVPRNRKIDALTRVLDAEGPTLAMIFCRTKHMVDELGEALMARGYSAETLHGDLSQAQRDRVMRRFRTGQADILIATDVAARGLDIPDVSHVINYDIPESAETYVHRIGRTGRAGKTGTAITLVTNREVRWIRQIERAVRARIEPRRLPTVADVAERRIDQLKQQLLDVTGDESLPALTYYLNAVTELGEEIELATLAAAALKLYAEETGRGQLEETADDVAVIQIPSGGPRGGRFDHDARGGDRRGDRGDRDLRPSQRGGGAPVARDGVVRLFLNVGHNLGIRPQDIVGAIANEANVPGRSIGSIDIFDSYSFVEVPSDTSQQIIDAISNSGIKGKYVNVEIARPDAGGRSGGGRREGGFDRDRGGYDRGGDRGGYRGGGGGGGYDRDRSDRADRSDRGDRPEPGNDRFERPARREDNRGNRRGFDDNRGNRYDRPDRFGRGNDRSDRPRFPGNSDRDRF